ncbi:MAG: hypothetical protein Q8P41_13485 [Pseudomonadota bacterium]|nr:hypothetical protein [Pseudomonadota bacterium]
MWGLLALLGSAHAADVLFVEATPVTLDDFSVAGLFYGMVVSAAEEEGLSFDDEEAIRAWAGTDADTCWDVDACPANLWGRTNARLVVVISVGQSGGGLEIGVRLHGADDAAPFKVLREFVRPGQEGAFAQAVARAAKDALPLLPSRKPVGGPVLVIEDEFVVGDDAGRVPARVEPTEDPPEPDRREPVDRPPRADREPRPEREPRPDRVPRADRIPSVPDEAAVTARIRADDERRRMGVPVAAYARYEASGESKEDWLRKARVRAGHGFLELYGGYGLGDIDRGYGVRLRIEEEGDTFDTVGTSTWEGAGTSGAPAFGFALGYAPAWFLDTSVAVSVQYGTKYLDTGWECLEQCDPPASEFVHDPARAVQAFIEPRLRLYPVATGVVKPYALLAFSVLLHDGFTVPDPDFVDYPDSPAGAALGPTAGLGLAFDPLSRITIYAEVPATLLLTPSRAETDGDVTLDPGRLESGGYIVRFVGGIGVRL